MQAGGYMNWRRRSEEKVPLFSLTHPCSWNQRRFKELPCSAAQFYNLRGKPPQRKPSATTRVHLLTSVGFSRTRTD